MIIPVQSVQTRRTSTIEETDLMDTDGGLILGQTSRSVRPLVTSVIQDVSNSRFARNTAFFTQYWRAFRNDRRGARWLSVNGVSADGTFDRIREGCEQESCLTPIS